MDIKTQKEVTDTIKGIRSQVHSNVDSSVIDELDRIIDILESDISSESPSLTRRELLEMLGKGVSHLITGYKLYEIFSD